MLSILYDEYKLYGCPNCGCDAATGSNVSGGGLSSGTCKHCRLHFEIRSNNPIMKCEYGAYPKEPSNPKSEWVMEEAIGISHPRKGIPAWHWEPKDVRPEEGEYWKSRGVGYDLSGFVKTKAAGERILALVKEVLEVDKCESWLDYRPSEPTWIQFKFQSSEFDLEKLDKLSKELGGVVTKELLSKCKK